MNWGGMPKGRQLAGLYLLAFTAFALGVLWMLIDQLTGHEVSLVSIGLFFGGMLVISALALWLGGRVTKPETKLWATRGGWQWVHHRLVLGLEVRQAWRAVRR